MLLARWLAMGSKLLILDEPTRGIDVGAKAEIQRIIKQLAEDGLGVLMISSELEEVIEGSDRVFVLREGRSVAELPHGEASEAAVMAAMAHGEAHTGRAGARVMAQAEIANPRRRPGAAIGGPSSRAMRRSAR